MKKSISFHEDTFYEYFRPFRHAEAHHDIWGGHGLETFGEDLELVHRHDPAFLWTVLDGESGPDQWIIPGFHYVNRVCYLITEKPHHSVDVEFRVSTRALPLTNLGLKRQVASLVQLLA
ncbi:MAG TPA: hypothetical protein VFO86_07415, partial [Terriglobia bacterium]|nr:hypothetical protein [Terriglobia bacterium]